MAHPTILIGFGSYGLRLLRLFLSGAAARGALEWTEANPAIAKGDRRIKGLALIWIPDNLNPIDHSTTSLFESEPALELFDDLYEQIQMIDGIGSAKVERLRNRVMQEANRLLSVENVSRGAGTGIGLDVLFLARPSSQQSVGSLRELMNPVLHQLGTDRVLLQVQQGGGNTLLNFIALFDFDDIWGTEMLPVLRSLKELLKQRKAQYESNDPVLGRIYLFDGSTPQGKKSAQSRLEEAHLFLDALLTEGIRQQPEMQDLFRPSTPSISPLCSIGVRSVERSSGLLVRLAAASYTRSWMKYLYEQAPEPPARTNALMIPLEPFRAAKLSSTVRHEQLKAVSESEVRRIEEALLALPADETWATRLEQAVQKELLSSVELIGKRFSEIAHRLRQEELMQIRSSLKMAIEKLLTNDNNPPSLAAILARLEEVDEELRELRPKSVSSLPLPVSTDAFDEPARMLAESKTYSDRQLQSAAFRSHWWPLFVVVFSIGLTPFVLDLFDQWGGQAVPLWSQLLLAFAVFSVIAWLWGHIGLQKDIDRLTRRARGFYDDNFQGRVADRIRRTVASPGIEGRLHGLALKYELTLRHQVLSAASHEMHRCAEVLRQRRREAQWMDRQCSAFLDLYSVSDKGRFPVFKDERHLPSCRCSLEKSSDLSSILSGHKRDPERFADLQSSLQLFKGWSDPYFDRLLHPTRFLDQQASRLNDEGLVNEEARIERGREIMSFFEKESNFSSCFRWLAGNDLPPQGAYAILPTFAKQTPQVESELRSGRYQGKIVSSSGDRLYLIHAQMNVPEKFLGEEK